MDRRNCYARHWARVVPKLGQFARPWEIEVEESQIGKNRSRREDPAPTDGVLNGAIPISRY